MDKYRFSIIKSRYEVSTVRYEDIYWLIDQVQRLYKENEQLKLSEKASHQMIQDLQYED
jgi:hypothetical protein